MKGAAKSAAIDTDFEELSAGWGNLPPLLKSAILAIARQNHAATSRSISDQNVRGMAVVGDGRPPNSYPICSGLREVDRQSGTQREGASGEVKGIQNAGFENREHESASAIGSADCDHPSEPLPPGLPLNHNESAEVAEVVSAWRRLSPAVRAGILVMVRASG